MIKKVCIYCSPNQPVEKYTKEHVIPQAFGKFKQNMVLNEGVCGNCNQFFSENLELFFARGSLESILRLNHKIKPAKEVSKLKKKRLRITLNSARAKYNGLLLEFYPLGNELVVDLIPQVGFPLLNGQGWVYVSEADLADMTKPLPQGIDIRGYNALVTFNSEEAKQRLFEILVGRNIVATDVSTEFLSFVGEQGYDETIKAIVKSEVDTIILRCVAKIGFNYLAKIMGINFVIKPDFDAIRAFIRYGKYPNYKIVEPRLQPTSGNQANGHTIMIGWSYNNRDIVGRISFFNKTIYYITFSKNFSDIWQPIRQGHYFNINTRKIEPHVSVSLANINSYELIYLGRLERQH